MQDADWAADGEKIAVVRFVPENSHWRLEYPIGKVLFDSINWISQPRISPDGRWIAFADHENTVFDDEGSVAVIDTDGRDGEKERKISSGWLALEGILWSPTGDEIWFTSTKTGLSTNPHGVTLSGKVRSIANVPGGMWLQDQRAGTVLMVTHQARIGIRGVASGSKEERELGWYGWSILSGISNDGRKILFEEEGDGGGPNYTVFLRDTDGSPPVRIGEGSAVAISPDIKWVITMPAKGGPMMVVPAGTGESRTLTHDSVSYSEVTWMPDGKHLLASGIESGHGQRDYMIDFDTGISKPITPEGTAGVHVSRDGTNVAVQASDGTWGILPLDGGEVRVTPGLNSTYDVIGWSPDGKSLYAASKGKIDPTSKVYKVDPVTGRIDFWRTFGILAGGSADSVIPPLFSSDGSAYAYEYQLLVSEAYLAKGLR